MTLSILIPCLPEHNSRVFQSRITNILAPQLTPEVELIFNDMPRSVPTGTKRNQMISDSKGKYFSQVDVDDIVPVYYVSELLKAIAQNPDVITFNGYMTTDGVNRKDFTIKLGENYEERNGKYFRYPNHLCCFKKSVVEGVKFRPIWQQEDYHWATDIKNRGLLKTSVHIEKDLYHYDFRNKSKHQTVQSRRSTLR